MTLAFGVGERDEPHVAHARDDDVRTVGGDTAELRVWYRDPSNRSPPPTLVMFVPSIL